MSEVEQVPMKRLSLDSRVEVNTPMNAASSDRSTSNKSEADDNREKLLAHAFLLKYEEGIKKWAITIVICNYPYATVVVKREGNDDGVVESVQLYPLVIVCDKLMADLHTQCCLIDKDRLIRPAIKSLGKQYGMKILYDIG